MIQSVPVFIGVTILFMGGCAVMTGLAVANSWRPWPHVLAYCLMMGAADRFLTYALFNGALLSPVGYGLDTAILSVLGLAAWRAALARRMCLQYPWLYERAGLFGWNERGVHHS